jgi:hypothetical protein
MLASPRRVAVVPILRHGRPSPWAKQESSRIIVAECFGFEIWIIANRRCSTASAHPPRAACTNMLAWGLPLMVVEISRLHSKPLSERVNECNRLITTTSLDKTIFRLISAGRVPRSHARPSATCHSLSSALLECAHRPLHQHWSLGRCPHSTQGLRCSRASVAL